MIFEGIHFSKDNQIPIGANIISTMHQENAFDQLWKYYKKYADENGIYFPDRFGFAYHKDLVNSKRGRFCYELEPLDFKFVTKADYRYSLQIIAEESFFAPVSVR